MASIVTNPIGRTNCRKRYVSLTDGVKESVIFEGEMKEPKWRHRLHEIRKKERKKRKKKGIRNELTFSYDKTRNVNQ